MESLDRALRGFRKEKAAKKDKKEKGNVDVMAERYKNGLDIWTGLPLEGEARKEWKRVMEGRED